MADSHDCYEYSNDVGLDVYLNPWWGIDTLNQTGSKLVEAMNNIWGEPDLWFQGLFHELLWGPRDLPKCWRPGFHVNTLRYHESCSRKVIWRSFWLPWHGKFIDDRSLRNFPYAAGLCEAGVSEDDIVTAGIYDKFIPTLRQGLKDGGSLLTLMIRELQE